MEIVHVQVYSNCVCARARGRGREQTCVCENEKMVGMYFLYFTNDTNGDTTQTYKPAPESMFISLWRAGAAGAAGAAAAAAPKYHATQLL